MLKRTASEIILILLLTSMATVAFGIQPVEASGTIYIRADGSVEPPTAPISSMDNVTYTFSSDIYDSVVVERDNIVVDGAGYTIHGTGNGTGMNLSYVYSVTLRNAEATNFSIGIYLQYSNNSFISANTVSNNRYGMYLNSSVDNTIIDNTVSNNQGGIYLVYSSNNNTVTGNNVSNNYCGIRLYKSSNNTVTGNNASNTEDDGIYLCESCNNNIVVGNTVSNNDYYGIWLYNSSNNTVIGNNASNNKHGIYLHNSGNNTVTGNMISENDYCGIRLYNSGNNTIFHNNLTNNTVQAWITAGYANTWDNGCEGNYWSDYNGTDLNGDGVGDTELPWSGVDYYPLVNPCWNPADVNHDLKVDMYDVVLVCSAYGSTPSDVNWNPHCDIANPYTIIDIYDIVTICRKYGTEYGTPAP